MVTVLVAGGGTGGHVFPMVAVGDALQAECTSVQVVYVGTGRGIETRVLAERGAELELLDVLPLRGRGLGGLLRGAARAAAVLPEARRLVKRIGPDVVFSVGGYAAGPVTLAARSLGVPVTLLEPNAMSGFTNRLLAPLVTCAYVGFPETKASLRARDVRWLGVPLRQRFTAASYPSSVGAEVDLLVLGGSQGALALNETVPRAVAACLEQGAELRVRHQTGRDKDEQVVQLYAELGVAERVQVTPFIDDVAGALAQAQVVIARAGASSVTELCAVGRPAILIPYPHAADDHQRHNAESLERAGGATCLRQSEATVERLSEELFRLASEPERRQDMAHRAQVRGRPNASRDIARDLLGLTDPQGAARQTEQEVLP